MSKIKTNAMRILDSNNINYNKLEYTLKNNEVDGVEVAQMINKSPDMVFKTLVAMSNTKNIYVYVIPVNQSLDLKKAANVSNEKNIAMINVNDMQKITGYIRGGCSPIGMKKEYKTFIHNSAINYELIVVSAGKKGHQVELNPSELKNIIKGEFVDIIKS